MEKKRRRGNHYHLASGSTDVEWVWSKCTPNSPCARLSPAMPSPSKPRDSAESREARELEALASGCRRLIDTCSTTIVERFAMAIALTTTIIKPGSTCYGIRFWALLKWAPRNMSHDSWTDDR